MCVNNANDELNINGGTIIGIDGSAESKRAYAIYIDSNNSAYIGIPVFLIVV